MKTNHNKPIVLVGGIAGTGKTTLSNSLLHLLNVDHSVGLGWIREVVCQFFSKEDNPELFSYSFRPLNPHMTPYQNLLKQSILLKPFIEACIDRAKREGTSLLLEGVNLIPGVIDPNIADFHFYLRSSDDMDIFKDMIMGESHKTRKITDLDIVSLKKMEAVSIRKCQDVDIAVIDFASNEKRLEKIISYIKTGG